MTYWAWAHLPLRCTRQTPDPWTAAAAPWSCSAGNPSASRIQPAPSSSPHKTSPTGHRERETERWDRMGEQKESRNWKTKTRRMRLLHLPCFCTVAKINLTLMLVSVCLFKRVVLVPGGGRETALLYFWLAPMCLCHALPPPFQSYKHRQTQAHTHTQNTLITTFMTSFTLHYFAI